MVENRISSVAARCPVLRGFHRRLQLLCVGGVPREWELQAVARELQWAQEGAGTTPRRQRLRLLLPGASPSLELCQKPNPAGTCPLPGGISDTKTVRVAHRGR